MKNNSLLRLISIQFKEYRRDLEVLVWGLVFPVALAWILGVAFPARNSSSGPWA